MSKVTVTQCYRTIYLPALRDILALLKEQETELRKLRSDVVELTGELGSSVRVVRCKYCKHKEESVSPSWEAWCNRLHCGCDLDWFCADGERKTK